MRLSVLGLSILILGSGGTGPARAQDGACEVIRVARVPLRDDGGYLSFPVSIAGQAVSMLVDTGSEGGLVNDGAVRALRLAIDPDRRTVMHGTGGLAGVVPNVVVPDMRIGDVRLGDMSIPVGDLPGQPMIRPAIAGLLGGDVLARFDVELDVAGGWLSLWRVGAGSLACGGPPAWRGEYDTIPLGREGHRVTIDAELDGTAMTALVDSGARSRIVSTAMAERVGVGPDRLAVDPGGENSGVDGRAIAYRWHRFTSLRIGRELDRGPVLTVAPLHDRADMLLGADWFAAHAVWISYTTGRMFVRRSPH
ncbi:aspartyl protease family protein [Gluconacetobacter tumulisoli]|uniref:aspartyl protease family protein n=1 Tax=Gluconacetobacter tumulisoli TaxID=1286189 RepID=UPI0038D031A6